MDDPERELKAAVRRYNDRSAALERAAAERDEAIRRALDAGLAHARVIAITELSPARIHQIRRAAA